MRRRLFPLFLLLSVCAFSATAQTGPKVIESESTFRIVGNEAVITIVTESSAAKKIPSARLWLLDTDDDIEANAMRLNLQTTVGRQTHEFRMALGDLVDEDNEDLGWYRLKYEIDGAKGIISLSQIMPDLFQMRIITGQGVFAGMTYRIRARAVHPFTEKPAAGVGVDATLEAELKGDENKKLKLNGKGVTDAEGFTTIDVIIPPEVQFDGDSDVTVTGKRAGIVRTAKDDVQAVRGSTFVIAMPDKPIYQPGQTFNYRALVMSGTESKVVSADTEIEFRIEDEDDTLLYREKVRSSSFGIAAISWRVPANAKLGTYNVTIRDDEGENLSVSRFKVSRYDLPNFAVTAKAVKPYYLPNEKIAEVEVRADYLFGKPVTKGKVRVVQEKSREWNYEEQKYEIDEGETKEGELDATGKYTAKFDLTEEHENIKDEDDARFRDVHFAAYITDTTTNKTEQRRFDIRVTRDPIHVYLIQGADFGNPLLPLNGYVSAFYADGTPAECTVEIMASEEDEDKYKTYARTTTNSFGGGKFSMPRPKIGDDWDDLDFKVVARDKNGRTGTIVDNVHFYHEDESVQVFTDKAIYKPGDTITAKIVSTIKEATVYVDVASEYSVVESHFTKLKDGKAEIRIPYSEKFKGRLRVAAFLEDPEDKDHDLVEGTRGILFPHKKGISVDASFDKAVYKPNEEASVKFSVLDSIGAAVESALGVVVFDKAVEERARTDADFGGMFSGMRDWLGYGSSFGSINIKDINELDLTKPISPELQLAAEIMMQDDRYWPKVFRSQNYDEAASSAFSYLTSRAMRPLSNVMQTANSNRNNLHASDDRSFRHILEMFSIDFDSLRDPWGMPYNVSFSVNESRDVINIKSSGPDKIVGTDDDFTVLTEAYDYFRNTGKVIDAATTNYHAKTGLFIRDAKTLFAELGVGTMLDRFGRPYHVQTTADSRTLHLRMISAGKDGKLSKENDYTYNYMRGDDFTVWTSSIDVFASAERKITTIQAALKKAPMNEVQFIQTLKDGGVDFASLLDGNGLPLKVTASKRTRYWEKVTFETVQVYGDPRKVERRVVTPVTQDVVEFVIKGPGRDCKPGTYDDVTFTQYTHILTERSKDDLQPKVLMQPISYGVSNGSITGVVTDAAGAVVPGAEVTATNTTNQAARSVTADSDGRFIFTGLASGVYSLRVTAANFKDTVMQGISVTSGATITLNVALEVGGVSETVNITSEAAAMDMTSASIGSTVTAQQISSLPKTNGFVSLLKVQPGAVKAVTKSGDKNTVSETDEPNSTPRLREYFPETLLWRPEIVTDADGKAEIKFRMADNITTWKMYTIASTKQGTIGVSEKEVAAFQAFFVDLDPPKFLTTGDEIFLPTQVRNYTEKKQNVNVTMSPANWFEFLGCDTSGRNGGISSPHVSKGSGPNGPSAENVPASCDTNGMKQTTSVASGSSENAVFGFKAKVPVKEGKQRVTAIAQEDSDAIERPVTVRPDGREIVHTESGYFDSHGHFNVNFPANALANSSTAELKIYPNLLSHVAESVDGLLRRPYGCGEQTISSTYPNLMILKFAGGTDGRPRRISESTEKKARKFLLAGYERLLGYQVADGGFGYWGGKDSADFALTAYALRFLADASKFIDVDEDVVKKAEAFLIKQQRADGSWGHKYQWENVEDAKRTKTTTTYVARVLASLQRVSSPHVSKGSGDDAKTSSLTKALAYLKQRNVEIDDPYSLALLGLAAHDSGDAQLAADTAKTIRSLARDEAGGVYWNLESNTAFNGWGTAGRVETTALATQLLMKTKADPEMASRAMVFMLKNKDRYGVWYSTQTTINVLDTFVAAMESAAEAGPQTLDVIVNGAKIQTLEIGPDKLDQIIVPLDGKLAATANAIELRSNTKGSPLMAQVVANHYIDWRDADSSGRTVNQSRALELDYTCDKTDTNVMNEISCSVKAERIGYRGYGMLLAEIGTPPGADVSRESLQAAMDADYSISRYDILPDRIVVYMWSKPGGTKLNFKFRPRYGINAQTPASTVYDYYNPEAQATVAPLRFTVK